MLGQILAQSSAAYGGAPGNPPQSQATQALTKQFVALQSAPAHPGDLSSSKPSPQTSRPGSKPQALRGKPPQPDANAPEKVSTALKSPPRAHMGTGYDQAFSTFQQPRQSPEGAQMTLTEQQQVEAAENAYSGGKQAGDGT